MKKILKSSSAHHLSQNNWRLLRKYIGRYLWKNLYTFSQKLKLPKMIKKLENSNLSLKNNLNYPQFTENKSFRKNSKFSDLISKYNTSKPEGEYRDAQNIEVLKPDGSNVGVIHILALYPPESSKGKSTLSDATVPQPLSLVTCHWSWMLVSPGTEISR